MRVSAVCLVAALATVCLAGCEWLERRRFEDDLQQRCAKADARVAQVELSDWSVGELEPLGPATRVLITPDAMHVDDTELVSEWWRTRPGKGPYWLKRPSHEADDEEQIPPSEWGSLDEFTVDVPYVARLYDWKIQSSDLRDGQSGLLIEPLYDALKQVVQIAKQQSARSGSEFSARLNVYADHRVPYRVIAQVVYTAGQAEYQTTVFAMRRGGAIGGLSIDHPKLCGGYYGSSPQDGHSATCLHPEFTVGRRGLTLRASRFDDHRPPAWLFARSRRLVQLKRSREPDAGPLPEEVLAPREGESRPEGEWHDSVILGPERECPAVGIRDGRIDLSALERLLTLLAKRVPQCDGGSVGAEPDVPWIDVARVYALTRERGGYPYLSLGPIDEEPSVSGCDGGLPVEELSVGPTT